MIRMNYLDLYVEDEDDVEMEEIADEEENVTDRNFINDSVSFSPSPSFYNRIDNTAEIQNVDRSKIMNCLQKKMILTKKVENFTSSLLQNPEFYDFPDEKIWLKNLKKLSFSS